ncbi:hypothetical protein [Nitriliruptor alkaliphilus]|uniref:hypothetical protein n=1 Tax=Nitriliruptor alkaliphilus TaxID=427918 RepID=UPI000698EDCF|nr:hypothetical protein [Nitriliruptor alkaliphilus]
MEPPVWERPPAAEPARPARGLLLVAGGAGAIVSALATYTAVLIGLIGVGGMFTPPTAVEQAAGIAALTVAGAFLAAGAASVAVAVGAARPARIFTRVVMVTAPGGLLCGVALALSS